MGAEVIVHLEPDVFVKQLRDIAMGIFDVAKVQGSGDAGIGACRTRLGIDAWRESFRRPLVNTIAAERAFLGNTDPPLIEPLHFLGSRRFTVGKSGLVYLVSRLIRAGDDAVGAAHAQFIVDGDNAIRALIGRAARTDLKAGRLCAMHAPYRHEKAVDVWKLPGLDIQHFAPLHPRRGGIGMLACRSARLAPNAQPQISDHSVARHAFPFWRMS